MLKKDMSGSEEIPEFILKVHFKDILKPGKLLENHLDSLL